MVSLEWKGIASCPRVHGKPVLLYEPGFGIQVGQWDMRRQCFVSPGAAFRSAFKSGSAPTVDDLFRSTPVAATKWAEVDLGDPEIDEQETSEPAVPPSRVPVRAAFRVIEGGVSAS